MFKKLLSCILCTVILCGVLSVTTLAVSTGKLSDAPEQVDGVMWFPAHPERQNDYLWEVEFDEGMYQMFMWEPEINYLDITYHDDGAVTFSRNQNGKAEYWPSVRTFVTSDYPYMKLTTADTLYFDFTVADNTAGAVVMTFNGLNIKLNGAIAKACGVSIKNSDADLPAGTYNGSLNLRDAFDDIADEGSTSSAGATVLSELSDDKVDVPTVTLYVVGGRDASVTMRALYVSAASDKNGKNCTYADAAMVYGLSIYDGEDVPPCDTPTDPEIENEDVEANVSDGLVTSAATAVQPTASESDGDFDWLPIIVIVVSAVVVVGGTIALIGALKK